MSVQHKVNAIRNTGISWLDEQFLELLERVLTSNTTTDDTSITAKKNAMLQLDRWYNEVA
jgi:hypothetical protein